MTVNVFLLKYNWLQGKDIEIVGKVAKRVEGLDHWLEIINSYSSRTRRI